MDHPSTTTSAATGPGLDNARDRPLALRLERLRAVCQLADSVARASTIEPVYDAALDAVEAALGADRAAVLITDEPGRPVRFAAWRRLSSEFRRTVEAERVLVAAGSGAVEWRPTLVAERIGTLALFPLGGGRRSLGALLVAWDQAHRLDGDDARLAASIARQVAFAVERRRAEEKLTLYREIFVHSTEAIAIIDADGRYVEQNGAHHRLIGYEDGELAGRTPAVHLGDQTFATVAAALERDGHFRGEVRSRTRPGEVLDVDLSAFTVRGRGGAPLCHVGIKRDVSARNRTERALRVLAAAGSVFDGSLDLKETVERIAALPVPALADGALVELPGPGGLALMAAAHVDPGRARALGAQAGAASESPAAMALVLRDAATVVGGADGAPEALALPDGNVARAWVAVPLRARGRTIGVLTLFRERQAAGFGDDEVTLAADLARRAALALDNALLYREAQESDRRKDELLAMLAHELRNPLAPILTAVELLRLRGAEPAAVERARGVIQQQAEHMTRLVDDLLDVSRLTRGRVRLRKETVDLGAVVARAVEVVRPLVEERRHRLEVHVEPGLRLSADPVRIEQVLVNLLNNAAKYTDPGGTITVSGARDGERVVVRVLDTGIGIPAHLVGRVFDLFRQGERSLDRSQGGLGIGLTVVRRLVDLHGGQVEARSDGPGRGSELVLWLPVGDVGDAGSDGGEAGAGGAAVAAAPGGGARKVLVVDDNESGATMLAEALEAWGHNVRVAHDGEGALALLESDPVPPDVVLLDIGLPGMDGYEVARRLRARPSLKDTVVLAVSGYGQASDRKRSREAGCQGHLVKPVDVAQLAALIAGAGR